LAEIHFPGIGTFAILKAMREFNPQLKLELCAPMTLV
jgi:hypothetical protein